MGNRALSPRAAGAILSAACLIPVAVAVPAQAAPAVDCTGTLTGSYQAINVPDGASCFLDGATVKRNVKIGIGSSLRTDEASIGGNVMGDKAKTVLIIDTPVYGQIHLTRTKGQITIGVEGCRTDPIADGNINLQRNYGPIAICQMTVKNNIILHNNRNRIGVFENRVGNNIQLIGNTGRAIRVWDNTMDNNLLVKNNKVAKAFTFWRNDIGGRANCTGNVISPTGGNNMAGGALTGQCSGLG